MSYVNALGYVVVQGPLDDWDRYAAGVLGMQKVDDQDEGRRLYRMDDRFYRLMVEEGEGNSVSLGLETLTERHLEKAAARLAEKGYETVEDSDLADKRHVRRLIRSTDPNGFGIELYYGQQFTEEQFVSPVGARFIAGDLGLGHAFVFVDDAEATADYYIETLGFKLSDTIDFALADSSDGIFLHCNPRHHSLAFAKIADVPAGLGHLMLEVDNLDGVGLALDRANEFGGNLVSQTLGRHTNDLMTSFYLKTPSGFQIEYGFDGRTVDDTDWSVGHHTAISSWGHKPVPETN